MGVRDEEEEDAPDGVTVARLVGDLSPRARGLRQDSESGVVESQWVRYPSPFIGVHGGGNDGLPVLPGGRDTGVGAENGVGLPDVPLPSLSTDLQQAERHAVQPPAGRATRSHSIVC